MLTTVFSIYRTCVVQAVSEDNNNNRTKRNANIIGLTLKVSVIKLKTMIDHKHCVAGTDSGEMCDKLATFDEKHVNNNCKQ